MARGSLGGVARKVLVSYTGTNPNAAAVTIKKSGTNTTDAVAANEQLTITNFELITETGGVFSVTGGTGGLITRGKLAATGGGVANSSLERRCLVGTPPTITATAGGQVDFTAEGTITKVAP